MSKEKIKISVKDWCKFQLRYNQTKTALKGSYKMSDRLEQELQTLKKTVKTYFMIESDYWANMNKGNISKYRKIQSKLDDLIK